MLGRFLEFSIVTPDIRESLYFYRQLGFSEAEVGDAWSHPYAVVTDGRIYLGLHQHCAFAGSVTFVKPDLLQHLDQFERLGLDLEFRRLGNDVFNEIGWRDPSGHLIRLLEARTFSPGKRPDTDTSLCGYFQEIALPAVNPAAAKEHWERFGFVGIEEPDAAPPRVSCTSDTIDVGLYEPVYLEEPALLFEVADLKRTVAALGAAGVTPLALPQSLRRLPFAMLAAPEGTLLLLAG